MFDRADNKIPGVSPNEVATRLGYDQPYGALQGLGWFAEYVWKDGFFMENANLLKAPAYSLVNLNIHYDREINDAYLRGLVLFFEVKNVFSTGPISLPPITSRTASMRSRERKIPEASRDRGYGLYICRCPPQLYRRIKIGIPMIVHTTMRRIAMPGLVMACVVAILLVGDGIASAQMSHHHAPKQACEEPTLKCASKVTPTFAPDRFWLAWAAAGTVSVTRSVDLGRTFSSSTPLNADPLRARLGARMPPKIAVDAQGRVFVAFAVFKDKNFNGQVLLTHSTDGGKSFAPLVPITADRESLAL